LKESKIKEKEDIHFSMLDYCSSDVIGSQSVEVARGKEEAKYKKYIFN